MLWFNSIPSGRNSGLVLSCGTFLDAEYNCERGLFGGTLFPRFFVDLKRKCQLPRLMQPYSPELNPDELLNADLKYRVTQDTSIR
jgi:hypothetical protein